MADSEIKVKKGTTTVGLICKDGIVLAAEKRATIGGFIADKKAEKIVLITDKMALTTAGTVSDAQLIVKLVRAELKLKQVRTNRESTLKEAANLLGGMIYGNIRKFSAIPGITQFLLAGVDDQGTHLYDLFVDGSVIDITDYVSSGSGSIIVYGILEALYKKDMTIKEGTELALKSINAAIQRDSASGNGIVVYTITNAGIKKILDKNMEAMLKM
ncbi:proteasome subunit beta [Candidatus Woesearchaeota archaeon]|nr:proteasome subunit beta [Candidatus Woesearchaeota archaeon]|tara:strand:+ start:12647 stop:13291 length:645 start_codon:yes stop_codon:yes gene_type:complete